MNWFHKLTLPLINALNVVRPIPPETTDEMRQKGLMWARTTDNQWIEVCDFCGGNCGQCGLTGRIGNVPFSMDRMAKKIGMG